MEVIIYVVKKRSQEKGTYFNKIKLLEKCVCLLSDCNAHSFVSNFPLFILNYFPDKIQTKTALILPVFISAESFSSAFLDFIPDNFIAAAFLHTVQNYLKRPDFIVTSFLTLGVIFSLLYKFFVSNLLIVGEKRFLLNLITMKIRIFLKYSFYISYVTWQILPG